MDWVLCAVIISWTAPGHGASALRHHLNFHRYHTRQPLPRLAPSQGSHTGAMKYFLVKKEKRAKHMLRSTPLLRAGVAHLHHCSLRFQTDHQKSPSRPKQSSIAQRSKQEGTSHLGNSHKKLQVYDTSCLDTWQVLSLPQMCGSVQPLMLSYLEHKSSLPTL